MKTTLPFSSATSTHSAWRVLVLLLMAYGLVLLSPIAFSSLRLAAQGTHPAIRVADWVPIAIAVGLALMGGAAMVTVLKRLVRDLAFSPYAGVAAAFGVLMGSALIALRAPFRVGELDSGMWAVFSILVSITGGAVSLRPGFSALTVGGMIALSPAPLLFLLFSMHADPSLSVQGLANRLPLADRTFLGLTSIFGLLVWLVAVTSRAPLVRAARLAQPRDISFDPTMLGPLTPPANMGSEPTGRISVWSFHDAPPRPEDFELPPLPGKTRGLTVWMSLMALLLVVAVAASWLWQ